MNGTLCWGCKKCLGGCPWSDSLKPVEGWTAEFDSDKSTKGYKVIECPLYEKGDAGIDEVDEEGMLKLRTALAKQIVLDMKVAMIVFENVRKIYERKRLKRNRLIKEYFGFFDDMNMSEEMADFYMKKIQDEVKDDMRILKRYSNGETKEELEKCYDKSKIAKALRLWNSTKDSF